MKLGLVIYSDDSETVWNAFRLGSFALSQKDEVNVFLLGRGVEAESIDTEKFKATEQMKAFVNGGGKIFACGSCLKIRHSDGSETCPLSTMNDLYSIIKDNDKILTF